MITHDGVIEAPQGTVVMIGDQINVGNLHEAGNVVRDALGNPVAGVIYAPTSVSLNSMVLLDAVTSVNMNGVISIPPYEDGETLNSTATNFTPAFVEMSGQLNVTLGSGALVSAPSSSVSLNVIATNKGFDNNGTSSNASITPSLTGAPGIVLAGPGTVDGVAAAGAVIDVAGLQDVQLPASYNIIAIQPRGIDFADEPLQRNGALYGQTLYIDIRVSGKTSNGTTWCGTPVANACGYVDDVPRSIDQLMTAGGSVSFKTDINTTDSKGNPIVTSVTLQPGSVINTAGGYEQFLPGTVPTTYLQGADGHLYNIADASPDLIYTGIAGQNTIGQPHWGITQTSTSLTETSEPGYLQGAAAGSISITTVSPTLQGTLLFGAVTGARQAAAGTLPSQGTLSLTTPASVVIGSGVSDNFTSTSPFTTTLSAAQLSSWGLSGLSITASDFLLPSGNTLNLAPGGSLSVTVPGAIDIAGTVSAPAGQISLVTDRYRFTNGNTFGNLLSIPHTASGKADIFIEGTLDVSGRWVNDYGQTGAGALGPGFINGGSISITTNSSSNPSNGSTVLDTTGSILLASGSLLDASSGGYISPQGAAQTASTGIMAGSAGSISLELYQGTEFGGPLASQPVGPADPTSGGLSVLQLNGTMRAYGFQSNGTLTLAAPLTIQIGGQPASGGQPAGGGFYIPTSLLTGGGFGAYVLESALASSVATETITVAAGTSLTLQQQNFSSNADYIAVPTGTKIATVAPLATLSDDLRAPVNLTLASDDITLGAGAAIVTDPKAAINFNASPNNTSGVKSVLLLGDIVDHGGAVSINMQTWLGSNATIDLSGTVIQNSLFGVGGNYTGTSDTVLAGGTFAVAAGSGYLVAQPGATVDVSGISATVMAQGSTSRSLTSVPMWSDAGSVTAQVGAFLWGGNFVAEGGRSPATGQANPQANNGTLMLGGTSVTLQQTSTSVISTISSLGTQTSASGLPTSLGSTIYAAVDRLGAFSDVFLYSASSSAGPAHIFTDLADTSFGVKPATFYNLTVSGPLDWSVANRLEIAASSITLSSGAPSSSVLLSAPYVLFTGGGNFVTNSDGTLKLVPATVASAPASRLSSLTVDAMNIDIEGAAFFNFANVTLGGAPGAGNPNVYTTADIMLSTPKVSNGVVASGIGVTNTTTPVDPSTFNGQLVSAGNLALFAERIYPVTAVNFTIGAGAVTVTSLSGTTTTAYSGSVTFGAPAGIAPVTPLSAGGSLTVNATTIVQDGNLFAPLGTITLGGTGTQQVTLGAGSLTSVSLDGAVVPYGTTADGTNWYYNDALAPLTQLPGKVVVLSGANVDVAAKSTIDLSGGGNVQASEFVQGTGGSTDTLATTSGQPTIYAILPSRSEAIAAFDINFTAAQSATQVGDPYPLAGTQITIAGGNGIPAGTYTLYPGHYATLPGALRVVDYGSNVGVNIASGTTLPDGTVLVTGNYTQSTLPGTRSSGTELFAVQTGAVWQQYSEYTFTSGNAYFAAKGQQSGATTAPPPLPIDAGRLAVVAQQQIVLAGTALTQPGVDSSGNLGRGGELDISGNQLVVVNGVSSSTMSGYAGYVGLDVNELNGFNFESILIGGLRTDQSNGTTTITPTATSVVVDTGGVAFAAPEILLVASAATQTQTINNQPLKISGVGTFTPNFKAITSVAGTGSVTITSDSVIDTTGGIQSSYGRNYVYANLPSAQSVAAALGGTLDSTGTVINGVSVGALLNTANGQPLPNVALTLGGGGAIFVASSDPNATVVGPVGTGTPALTVNFAPLNGNAKNAVLTSITLPASTSNVGYVTVEAGAKISTNTLSIQATASSNAIVIQDTQGGGAPKISANQLNLTAQNIGLGGSSSAPASGALVLSADTLANQFASIQGLALKAYNGSITFYSGNNSANGLSFGGSLQSLTLDAPALVGTGNGVDINAGNATVTLVNSGAAGTAPTAATGGMFSIEAAQINLGGGIQTITGFAQVDWTASNQVYLAGSGAESLVGTNAAPVNLAVSTPNILVGSATASGTGAQFALTTAGNVTIARPDGASANPGVSSQIGGKFALTAASIDDAGTIQTQAGTLSLEATTGNLTLESAAWIAAGGYEKTLIDQREFVAGGAVTLLADAGNVNALPGSMIDLSQLVDPSSTASPQARFPGYGGVLNVLAPIGSANLQGQIQALSGDPTRGGSFNLNAGAPVSLDALAGLLLAGGFTGSINIHTLSGNLQLSQGNTLAANSITLTADDTTWGATGDNGQVIIAGAIDAGCNATYCSGATGGTVALYGANAVLLKPTAQIDASTSNTGQAGGNVTLGVGTNAQGYIDLQTGSTINVSGGGSGVAAGSGGTVYLRSPIVVGTLNPDGSCCAVLPTVRIADLNANIIGARSFSVEDYVTVSTQPLLGTPFVGWNGIIDPGSTAGAALTNGIAEFVQGKLVEVFTDSNGQQVAPGVSYGFDGAVAMLSQPSVATMLQNSPNAQVNLLPGVELVNVNPTVNNGNITIASNWNLAAGTAINLQQSGGLSYYNPATSAVNFTYRYVADIGGHVQLEPGVLTLVAGGNINVNASISDGFFSFGNYENSTYQTNVTNYLNALSVAQQRGIDGAGNVSSSLYFLNNYAAAPLAPYDTSAAQANSANPTSVQLAGADLFPNVLNFCTDCNVPTSATPQIAQVTNPGSWSYSFTAGAAVLSAANGYFAISANPTLLQPLAAIQSGVFATANNGAGAGNVVVSGHTTYTQALYPSGSTTVTLPTMIRTGTGNITILAAQDILLNDPNAPGVIYAAGVNTELPAGPGYQLVNGNVVASNPSGFLEPQLLAYGSTATNNDLASGFAAVFGPPTAAAFPELAGNVTLVAQRDIVRTGNPTSVTTGTDADQYFFPWLLADAAITPVGSTTEAAQASLMGAGVFAPFLKSIASQSAWWIQYGSFQQGILSAGGNVSVTAGRDLIDVSVSLPTTGYTSGGLVALGSGVVSTPVTTVNPSGDMTVRVGRNILGGSFYEGSGTGTIVAGGSVGANGTLTFKTGALQDLPLLAVDTGQITLTAGGSVSIGGVINPAELHAQTPALAAAGEAAGNIPLFMDTYGPSSAASIVSVSGNINIANSQTSTIYAEFTSAAYATEYPASFSAIALNGNITTVGLQGITSSSLGISSPNGQVQNPGISLAGSPNGSFQLLAQGSVDLTGGLAQSVALTSPGAFPSFSTGPSLLDAAFDPYQPNNGQDAAFNQAVLAQQTNASTARIYAVTGSITGAGQISINRPAAIQAGLDVVDLNLAVENIAPSDVSTVIAGRDITYTGYHNLGGMQIAGPGFFVAQAGRNLGPFLPVNFDTATYAQVQEGIASIGNAGVSLVNPLVLISNPSHTTVFSTLPVGNGWAAGSPGTYNQALLGPYASAVKNRNPLLPTTGADIVTLFGVGTKPDYQAVIDTYIDPANAANVAHNYMGELTTFMCTTGELSCSNGTPPAGTDVFGTFRSLPAVLQDVFVDQVFTAELKNVANSSSSIYQYYKALYDGLYGSQETLYKSALTLDAYIMINTLFPAASGYTNNLSGPLQPVGSALAAVLDHSSLNPYRYAVNVPALVQSVDLSGAAGDFQNQHPTQVATGDLNLLHATIQTDLGGSISILGPGGNVLVGSLAVEPNPKLQLNNLGILTLSGGSINSFTDGSVEVNTSRIFTEQGGDISLWSSNADLDAGRGAKTTTSQPPLDVFFDVNDFEIVNPAGLVTGAGIGVLQTTSNSAASNLYLQAPRGVINLGSAGVRSSGNLVLVAPVITNASNASVSGTTTGVPTVTAPNIGALTAAGNTAGASTKSTETPTGSVAASQPSIFVVEVLGYGGGDTQGGGDQTGNQKNNSATP